MVCDVSRAVTLLGFNDELSVLESERRRTGLHVSERNDSGGGHFET